MGCAPTKHAIVITGHTFKFVGEQCCCTGDMCTVQHSAACAPTILVSLAAAAAVFAARIWSYPIKSKLSDRRWNVRSVNRIKTWAYLVVLWTWITLIQAKKIIFGIYLVACQYGVMNDLLFSHQKSVFVQIIEAEWFLSLRVVDLETSKCGQSLNKPIVILPRFNKPIVIHLFRTLASLETLWSLKTFFDLFIKNREEVRSNEKRVYY